MSTSWRLLATNARSSCASGAGSGLADGRIAWAKCARAWASRASVLASFPAARAKSRTCLGFTTATARWELASSPARAISIPPVASSTISRGATSSRRSTSPLMPRESWETCQASPVGHTATSKRCLDTSMPTNTGDSFFIRLPPPTMVPLPLAQPCLIRAPRPLNCSGSG